MEAITKAELTDIQYWCKNYRYNKNCTTTDPIRRFIIGFYQMNQIILWSNTDSKYESTAAIIIHLILVAEEMNLPIEIYFSDPSSCNIWDNKNEDSRLLCLFSLVAQQLLYGTQVNSTVAIKRRYNSRRLTICLMTIIHLMLEKLPLEKREDAFYNASRILLGYK